jgi:DNA-directed RNA polymerase subunit RPC12/RpoP
MEPLPGFEREQYLTCLECGNDLPRTMYEPASLAWLEEMGIVDGQVCRGCSMRRLRRYGPPVAIRKPKV